MEALPYRGSSSNFYRITGKQILKSPMLISNKASDRHKLDKENKNAIRIERQILEMLGQHPRIVPYQGAHARGILLTEAPYGSLQAYLDSKHADLDSFQRSKLCEQAAESIEYLHRKGVIHSDLRPENFLVAQIVGQSVDLWLCDFGGSTCTELGLDGGHMPDTPFFDPRVKKWESTPATDIFSLGSIFFTIQKGHWPFLKGPPRWSSLRDKIAYEEQVEEKFNLGEFPDVSSLSGGNVIEGCWNQQYMTAEEVLKAVRLEMCKTNHN
ncbi:MAG: hypothetical protein M1814_005220 [Vezdaea aestivalis]|nr:MAG: hypothetical protein M1814_005220 [Vezdaea aestivalis]